MRSLTDAAGKRLEGIVQIYNHSSVPGVPATLDGMRLAQRAKAKLVEWESLWFDWRWGVCTNMDGKLLGAAADRDHYAYLPTRPSVGLQILRDIHISSYADYTFVDYGSGKGRMLLLAARYPFRAVHGIEYDQTLHQQSVLNCHAVARSKKIRSAISCFHMDAPAYEFPETNLLLYFFNPFSVGVFTGVLNRLRRSLDKHPRTVFLVTLYPETKAVPDLVPQLKLIGDKSNVCTYSNAPDQ